MIRVGKRERDRDRDRDREREKGELRVDWTNQRI
jgi:hypothetical protein